MDPLILAIYLPQYYRTEYNDRWWGEGYTEWTACKKAMPLFEGHVQPRIPYREYDLSQPDSIYNQVSMAKEYGIDGFVIYQYYSLGNKLLEVPTESILRDKNIDARFCLYWANESWESRWYGQETKVLWKQEYGTEQDWKDQFSYCLPFFQDDRYIKVDNKPVYIIYKDWNFKAVDQFIQCWNQLAKQNSFDGIYFIKTVAGGNTDEPGLFNATFEREPFYTFTHGLPFLSRVGRYARSRVMEVVNKKILMKMKKGIIQYRPNYQKCCDLIARRGMVNGARTIPGAFTDWDNSPRRQFNSTVFEGVSPEIFEDCLRAQYRKAAEAGSPFVIINAWNEWGEGNYLEPDQYYGDGFLQAVRNVKEMAK